MRGQRVAGSAEIVPDAGPVLRLSGLLVPEATAQAAGEAIARFGAGQRLVLSGPARTDRHGRRVAQVRRAADGAWLQADLVESGLAVLTGADDGDGCLATLRALETAARAAGRGFWDGDSVGPFSATDPDLASRAGRFALVEGRILSTGQTSRTRFLNFGGQWALDFTVTISESEQERFAAAGFDPGRLKGERVRVRGWLLSREGGAMRLHTPGQIERLGTSE